MPAHLIIPCFREEKRLPPFLSELLVTLAAAEFQGRVLVVDDGSGSESAAALETVVESARGSYPTLLEPLLRLPSNRGKGGAVLAGWQAVADDCSWFGFVDADGAIPAAEVLRCFTQLSSLPATPPPVLYAVRTGADGTRVTRAGLRNLSGHLFRWMVRLRHGIQVVDTQCGHKWLSAAAWESIDQRIDEPGFAFDIDLTLRLRAAGCKIHSLPIDWHESPGSHLGLRAAAKLFCRALTLRSKLNSSGF